MSEGRAGSKKMKWIDKRDSKPDRGEMVLFGYIITTGGISWKEYKAAVFDRIDGTYLIDNIGHIICTVKQWKCWCKIDEFPKG